MFLASSVIWALGIVPLDSVSTAQNSVIHRVMLCTGLDASPAERLPVLGSRAVPNAFSAAVDYCSSISVVKEARLDSVNICKNPLQRLVEASECQRENPNPGR
ncbi:hypothetical protein BDV09DRAFT_2801 [Aspergillus tetrazonus]